MDPVAKAARFLELHTDDKLLILPNVWDPVGARLLAHLGYPAVATASAAIAFSLGYDDGQRITFGAMLEAIRRVANSVDVPVTADIERGYANNKEELADNVARVIETGAVGVNIEDSRFEGGPLLSVGAQCVRIRAVRRAADAAGVPIVINARTDVFLREGGESPDERLSEAITRGRKYLEAGANCIYPIGFSAIDGLRRMVAELKAPINVYASAATPPIADLEAAGVARLSVGPGLIRASLTAMRRVGEDLLAGRSYESFTKDTMTSDDIRRFLDETSM